MSLFKLITNTVEGAIQAPIAATKYVTGATVAMLDDGKMMEDASDDLSDAVEKIGKSK
ncbi:hypothetical protein [Sulfitobacter sp. 20_GPM-1509m]|uniref:hypothetical protein n=1 Tax=Sulfitobacter sp. 20_GPM-1509m TaxID=1380367 RepID=UPI000AC8D870|nr:hypothetical protein [Sulfitobacter sp. 20_GPM-1509m]